HHSLRTSFQMLLLMATTSAGAEILQIYTVVLLLGQGAVLEVRHGFAVFIKEAAGHCPVFCALRYFKEQFVPATVQFNFFLIFIPLEASCAIMADLLGSVDENP